MSDSKVEVKTDNSEPKEVTTTNQVENAAEGAAPEPTTKGRRSSAGKPKISRIMKDVQEGEALLKEMGHSIDGADEGRRRTRSSMRGGPPPPPTPPPVKRERRSGSSSANNSAEKAKKTPPAPSAGGRGGRGRGRPKRQDEPVEANDEPMETEEESGKNEETVDAKKVANNANEQKEPAAEKKVETTAPAGAKAKDREGTPKKETASNGSPVVEKKVESPSKPAAAVVEEKKSEITKPEERKSPPEEKRVSAPVVEEKKAAPPAEQKKASPVEEKKPAPPAEGNKPSLDEKRTIPVEKNDVSEVNKLGTKISSSAATPEKPVVKADGNSVLPTATAGAPSVKVLGSGIPNATVASSNETPNANSKPAELVANNATNKE